jgi:hypothetical protein
MKTVFASELLELFFMLVEKKVHKTQPLVVVVNMEVCTGNIVVAGKTTTTTITTHFLLFLAVYYINFMHNLTFAKIP